MYQVLLVDDEYMILKGLQKLISWNDLGFEIAAVKKNGKEALEFVRTHDVDIVITDVTMPILSGIDFIKQAQQEGLYFRFIVLSGYEEFNYVKESLRLGAENYLIKPIDKDQLIESLKKCVKEFEEEKVRMQGEVFLFEHLLRRWVNDDIDYMDLKRLSSNLGKPIKGEHYNAIVFQNHKPLHEQIRSLLDERTDIYYFHDYDENKWVVLYYGNLEGLDHFLHMIKDVFNSEDICLGVGETVDNISDVYLSYEHAVNSIHLHSFYRMTGNHQQMDSSGKIPNLSFVGFNEALVIRDIDTIKEEIDHLLANLKESPAPPDYTRHIIFLIFMDIYRQFDILDEAFYQHTVEKITKAASFETLRALLEDVLSEIVNKKGSRIYSPNIQKALKIIHEEYQQDLSLKYVADQLHLNVMYLGQLFKKETKKSFSQYLNHFRIKLAQELLLNSGYNVNEITEKIGYTSSGYFYKNFKKICGLSPKEFREVYKPMYNPVDS
ncbi:two-component system response regulator YesN [Pullulanibacillus pueri]|uniref:DNA-binding response regulator n=1 Tax=Pullulanibacillus pueri TaxID=1437324 RepID=A0A8J2ZUU0_9BACL|nr:response regulator transcription factor [Pullulanibacillus pueri]MBM7682083.1 two-component system response regulator YesN [Pullulanibacillus pueri]GGH80049.1 DNA-binding response regulator [Pullulanibacillus pueri]